MIIEEKSFHLMSTPVQRTIYDECVFHMPVVKKSHDPTPSLRDRIHPYFLRRLKSEIFNQDDEKTTTKLSQKQEIIVWLRLTSVQVKYAILCCFSFYFMRLLLAYSDNYGLFLFHVAASL